MNRITIVLSLCLTLMAGMSLQAQTSPLAPEALRKLKPEGEFDNIQARKLHTDGRASSYVIWVKEQVPAHYHASHSEYVVVIKGKATMTLGEEVFTIKKGDMVYIPQGTPHSVRDVKGKYIMVLSIQAPEFYGEDRIPIQ